MLRMPLSRPARRRHSPFEVRELARSELAEALEHVQPELTSSAIDAIAPGPWRAFLVYDEDRVIHHSFIGLRDNGWVLFGCWTSEDARGRGAFVDAIVHIAGVLHADGIEHLDSSCSADNAPSVRAHRRAGFEVTRRVRRPFLLGVDLRAVARRVLRR